jgi:hypothetical protein
MKKSFIVKPTGLKGGEKLNRMRELMGSTPLNEDVKNSVVELTKLGPYGKVYGLVREGHNYFIKVTDKQSNVVTEDFNYMGGLMNKTSEVYPTYAKAIKQLNLKFMSLNEAHGKTGNFNIFEDDNLLNEHHPYKADQALSATKGMGDGSEYVVDKKGTDLSYDAKEGKDESQFGDNLADKDVVDEFETVKLSENEMAIENMLSGEDSDDDDDVPPYGGPKDSMDNQVHEKETNNRFSLQKAIDEMDSIIKDEDDMLSEIINTLSESQKRNLLNTLKKKV